MSYFFVDKRPFKPVVKQMSSYEMALNYLNKQASHKDVYVIEEEYELVTGLFTKRNGVVCKFLNGEYIPVHDFNYVVPLSISEYNQESDNDSETTNDSDSDSGSFVIEDVDEPKEGDDKPKNEMFDSSQLDKLLNGQMASMMSLFQNLQKSPEMASLMGDLTKDLTKGDNTEDITEYTQ